MRTPDMYIGGLGAFLPGTVSVERAVEQGVYSAEDAEMHEFAGAAVAGAVPAPEMALRAAEDAVKRAGRSPEDLDLLLYSSTWHQGPDGWLPHSYLQRHLVGGDVPAVEVRQGCNGMFGALELAASYLRAEPERSGALLVAADNYGTPLINRWYVGQGLIVGDAASAVVLTKEPGFAQLLSVCSTTVPEGEELHRSGEPMFPPTATTGSVQDFGSRFRHYHASDPTGGSALARIPEKMKAIVHQALDEAGTGIEELARAAFITHSREIVEQACMTPLGLPMSKSTWEYGRTIGHCGASDQILALDHLVTTGQLGPGDHMLLLGMAPGVVLSAAVVKILETPSWSR